VNPIFFAKLHYRYKKTPELDFDFEFAEKVHKNSCQKSKWENGIFDFYYCVQKFSAYKFCRINFLALFQPMRKSASNFVFYDKHFDFLPKKLVAPNFFAQKI
jgi:hypothetical protein